MTLLARWIDESGFQILAACPVVFLDFRRNAVFSFGVNQTAFNRVTSTPTFVGFL
jgi:hypothetical protein